MSKLEELNETLQHYKDCVVSTKEEIAKTQRDELYQKEADTLFSIYSSFVSAGFTHEQAWEMLITSIKCNKN